MTKINATKSAIEFASANDIDLNLVTGSSANGRIGLGDVRQFAREFEATVTRMADEVMRLPEAEDGGQAVGVGLAGVYDADGNLVATPDTIISVRLVGAQTAVLDGKSILRNESHRVTYRAYCRARDNHPNKFAVKFGDMPDYRTLG